MINMSIESVGGYNPQNGIMLDIIVDEMTISLRPTLEELRNLEDVIRLTRKGFEEDLFSTEEYHI
jgi:hypothetical protein